LIEIQSRIVEAGGILSGVQSREGNKSDGEKAVKNGGKSGRIKNSGPTDVGPLGVRCISDAIIRG
jgi:hypothetical protein